MTAAPGRPDFLALYVSRAPLALALERVQECRILSAKEFDRPILDLGCGDGVFAEVFFQEPVDYGLDPDPAGIKRARGTNRYLRLFNSGGNSIPLDDSSVGTIVCNSVLEHIPDIDPVLGESARILKPGGRFYLTLPTDHFDRNTWISVALEFAGLSVAAASFRRLYNRFWHHHHAHDIPGWTSIFERNGLRVSDCLPYASRRQCLIDDALIIPALPAFIAKKILGRWSWFPRLRRLAVPLILPIADRLLDPPRQPVTDRPGLVFFELTRG